MIVNSRIVTHAGRALCNVRLPDGTDLASLYPDQWRIT